MKDSFINRSSRSASRILLWIILILFVFSCKYNLWRDWRGADTPFTQDGDQYYSYVIAAFIQHDMSFSFPNNYWLTPVKSNGNKVARVSMGMAYLFTPPFLIAHVVAKVSGYPTTGYSAPYSFGNYYFGFLFVLFGLIYLRKILLMYFSEWVTLLTIVSVFIGTNLMYYTVGSNTMTHSYLFTLFVLLIYSTIKWYETNHLKYILSLGFVFGLIVIIRPTDIITGLFPLLYNIKSFNDLKARFYFFIKNRLRLLVGALIFFLPWIPQFLYWKYYTGSFLFYPFTNEGFYFSDPQLFNVLLSYRKGWLVYTPIMLFSLIGFFMMRKKGAPFFISTILIFIVTYYLVSSWWSWWWGGSFGMRALIQHYAFLAIPMACFYDRILEFKIWKKITLVSLIVLMSSYSVFQTIKYQNGVIHWDSMTKEAFWYGFFKTRFVSAEEWEIQSKLLSPPDYTKTGN